MLLSTNRRSTQQILDYSKQYFLARTAQQKQFQKELANFKSSKTGPLPTVIAKYIGLSQLKLARMSSTISLFLYKPLPFKFHLTSSTILFPEKKRTKC